MRASTAFMVLATTGSTLAAPLEARNHYAAPPGGDVTILNYALTLEYLERKFYQEGLKNYTKDALINAGCAVDVYERLQEISYDEETHVNFLKTALADKAVGEPTFRFPSTDAKSFLQLSSILEGVGVSAYTGAAQAILEKTYLTAAASILDVEARHSSYIREVLKQKPFPKPFDTPLAFNQVFSLAAQFITGNAPNLPFKAFPKLALQASQYAYTAGRSSVTFSDAYSNALNAKLISSDTPVYAVFFSGLDTYYVRARVTQGNKDFKIDTIPGPDYASKGQLAPLGQVYVLLSTADGTQTKVDDANTISGVGVLEVIPK